MADEVSSFRKESQRHSVAGFLRIYGEIRKSSRCEQVLNRLAKIALVKYRSTLERQRTGHLRTGKGLVRGFKLDTYDPLSFVLPCRLEQG